VAARAARLPYRFARNDVTRQAAREFGGLAGYVTATEAAATAIFTLNRAILGLFESAATIGLYEGPVRAHNLLRSLSAATTVTVLPTSAGYTAAGDERRLRELTLRGARYSLALAVPLTVTGMVLAAPILDAWLGDDFGEGGTAMAILLSHWLLSGANGVLGAVLVGTGRARELARWAVAVSACDVVLALVLVPALGLEGVALATAVPYFALFPMLARSALDAAGLDPATFLRQALVPAWLPGIGLAIALTAARLTFEPEAALAVAATALAGLAIYWAVYYAFVLGPSERKLVHDVAGGLLGR
jgi:O-antigen/teichoic acid export membrane protein